MDLLEWKRKQEEKKSAPLAARMRPTTLDEFVGQDAIVGPGRLLRRAIQADRLSSLLFYGPPGTGKTTLAQIIANSTRGHFIALNAVLSGVKDIRVAIQEAQMRRDASGNKTILFIDEVHRFNKAQQDALLPWVENGTVILIGATTENPYFEVNRALVSRSRVFQLKGLDQDDLRQVIQRVLDDPERGYGGQEIQIEEEAINHLVNVANGDARALLNALELAIETTPPDEEGQVVIPLTVAEESIQQRAVLYDKEGDAHFDTISAFIKSIRGSDPDASLYWLARMIYAGEDPKYVFRRLLILASEDIGLADPQAITVVNACAQSFDRVGMPEGQFHLAHATLYLANTDKSNSTLGFFDALRAIQKEQEDEVPNHLKDGKRDKEGFGHGKGYLYPHAYKDHWVAQQYLPANLQGKMFYQPNTQGWEGHIQERVARQREAQLAAMLEGEGLETAEVLSTSPEDKARERWFQRTLGEAGARVARQREHLMAACKLQRHFVVLDLHARTGLLTWEALRQVPEGSVVSCAHTEADAKALREQSQRLDELQRPRVVLVPPGAPLAQLGGWHDAIEALEPGLHFDRIIGRNILTQQPDRVLSCKQWLRWLRPEGQLHLVEPLPEKAQRITKLLQPEWLPEGAFAQLLEAEDDAVTQMAQDGTVLSEEQLHTLADTLGCTLSLSHHTEQSEVLLTPTLIQRWVSPGQGKPSFRDRVSGAFSGLQWKAIEQVFLQRLSQQVVPWNTAHVYLSMTNQGS